jgi:hypothetical protein
MRSSTVFRIAVLGALFGFGHAAHATDADPQFAAWGAPVSSEKLRVHRGGTDMPATPLNAVQLNAKMFNNSANFNLTGNNVVSDGAFANASGLPTVIQNSGNNVIIQNSTILNLNLK